MKKKTEKYCRYCGKPFMPDKDNKNYCKECTNEHSNDELTYSRKKHYRLAAKYGIDPIGMSVLDIMGLLTTTCPNCGKEFIKDCNNDVYCPECMKKERKKLKKEAKIRRQNEEKRKTVIITPVYKTPKYTINDIVNRANKAGLSYGEYVARYHI